MDVYEHVAPHKGCKEKNEKAAKTGSTKLVVRQDAPEQRHLLASNRNRFMTGETIIANGGYHMAM